MRALVFMARGSPGLLLMGCGIVAFGLAGFVANLVSRGDPNPSVTIGNLVTQDSTLLTTIVSLDPIYAYFDVDEYTLLRVRGLMREGKIKVVRQGEIPVDLGLSNEDDRYPHQGYVDFVNTQIDPSTGTIQLRGVFPNPKPDNNAPRLLAPGMFIRIRVPVGKK